MIVDHETIYSRKILLIDDETSILNLLEVVLKKEHYRNIYKASSGREALQSCRTVKPDMIVLDIMLPDMDGYEVCRQIRDITMSPILFLSAKSDEIDRVVSFAVGGDDYLTKPFSPREVVAHINAALRRLNYYESKEAGPKQVSFGEYILDLNRRELYKNHEPVAMTSKEYLLLEYLVKNRNITVSKEKIIEQVWGGAYEGYDNTVMVHIRHVREKIEPDPSSPRFLKTVKGRGYRFEIPEDMK